MQRTVIELLVNSNSQTELKELEKQLDSSDSGILGSIQFSVKNNEAVEFDEPRPQYHLPHFG